MSGFTTSGIKKHLRKIFGDEITSSIHALRFILLARKCIDNEPELSLLPMLVKENDIVIDVGANGADWTKCLSTIVKSGGKVFAFEVDPYYALATKKAISLMKLKNVVFFSFGLSDKTEKAKLIISDSNGDYLSGQQHVSFGDKNIGFETCEIQLYPLDSIATRYPELYKISLLKCDVEGMEPNVIRGAIGIIRKARPIIIWEKSKPQEMFELLGQLDYRHYFIKNNLFHECRQDSADIFHSQQSPNILSIPTDKINQITALIY